MKKLLSVLTIGLVFVLAACSNRLSGDTVTVCTGASAASMGIAENATVTIVGSDESIITWTERYTLAIADYENYWFRMTGVFLDNVDIEEWFAMFDNPIEMGGLTWHLVSIDGDQMTIEAVYHYNYLTDAELSEMWGTDFSQVTITSAINGFEYVGASCTTN